MWSYVYIAQTTGKDAGKNRGDLLQVTSSSEFVGLGDPGTSCSFGIHGQQRALSSVATQLTRWALKIGDDFFELFVSFKLPFFGGNWQELW